MTRRIILIAMAASLATAATIYAGTGLQMKCRAKPEKDPKTGRLSEPCGHESFVSLQEVRLRYMDREGSGRPGKETRIQSSTPP